MKRSSTLRSILRPEFWLLVLCLGGLGGCTATTVSAASEMLLNTYPPEWKPQTVTENYMQSVNTKDMMLEKVTILQNQDHPRVAYVVKDQKKEHLVIDSSIGMDSSTGDSHDEILAPIIFSKSGIHVAYIARDGTLLRVVRDNSQSDTYNAIYNKQINLTPSGEQVWYVFQKGNKWGASIGNNTSYLYDEIIGNKVNFSSGDRHYMVFARTGTDYFVETDGNQVSKKYFRIYPQSLKFNQVKQQFGYLGVNTTTGVNTINTTTGVNTTNPSFLQIKSFPGETLGENQSTLKTSASANPPEYDEVKPDSFNFTDDGMHFAFVAKTGTKWFVVLDDQKQKEYDDIYNFRVLTGEDTFRFLGLLDGNIYDVTYKLNK